MTRNTILILGAGLFVALNGTAQARPAQPSSLFVLTSGGHAPRIDGGRYEVVRRKRHKVKTMRRATRKAPHVTSMATGMRATSTSGTSNVTTGSPGRANTGQNGVDTAAAQRRRVNAPGPLTNNGQAAP